MKKMSLILSFALLMFVSCQGDKNAKASYNVIPLPQTIEMKEGNPFLLSKSTKIAYPSGNDELKQTAEFLAEYIQLSTGIKLGVLGIRESEDARNLIILKTGNGGDNPDAYSLTVTETRITIEGSSGAGVFYGIQTLRKSIPIGKKNSKIMFPAVNLQDYPRFQYRGAMLDVSRHFFSPEFVKKYIDILALHNLNRMHWHLSDDQGWRIEIKKYPELTSGGSQRKETVIGRNSSVSDGKPYGGFYTQEQIKDIVDYANKRFITIIPEIDLPGHMLAALTAYPELGCTGGPYEVGTKWGVYDDVLCVGNEKTFTFLEDVFTELLQLFPSKYIHIGGDECPKVRWQSCSKCQAKIKELGLTKDDKHSAEEKLQSYCISRMEKFLNSKGRNIIGWDEILEGGLAPNATVMSWRGVEGGIAAAKQGNDVIMTPTSHLYFDYYQTKDTKNEPLAFGGLVTLEKVYSFNPIPDELVGNERKHIIGVQANLWTEYIETPEHVEYMMLPRLAALSEVQWSAPEKKDYKDFMSRLFTMTKLYDKLGYNYSKRLFDIETTTTFEDKTIVVSFSTIDNAPIYYTLDGSTPTTNSTKYTEPIRIDKSAELRAVAIRGDVVSNVYEDSFNFNKATLKPIKANIEPTAKYAFGGINTLVDGKRGGGSYSDGSWIGYFGEDFEAVIDLQSAQDVSSVKIGTFVSVGDWVFGATSFKVAVSDDNTNFKEVFSKTYPVLEATQETGVIDLVASFDKTKAKYVKVSVGVTKSMPEWHTGKGRPSFLFLDEIIVQ